MFFAIGLAAATLAQSFNIDFDIFGGDPGIGNGVPSASFGAAAGQPGFWNRFSNGTDPRVVRGLDGTKTEIALFTVSANGSVGAIGYRFEGNTGDYALLLNDAIVVGPLIDGNEITYKFAGLQNASYLVYTYAAHVAGLLLDTPVTIPGANPTVEIVTGPMPGNAFGHLITHTIHEVNVTNGTFDIELAQPPNYPSGMCINGIQVAMVPEPTSAVGIVFGLAILLLRRSKLGSAEREKK